MAPTAISDTPQIKSRIGAILRATSGNFLEQFDFFLFGFYAAAIGKAFFPSDNETASLLNTFGVFWLGALMRPVGAIVLGAYIDRIGRRQGLIVTLAIMAIGTVIIAFCPSYATIGVAAPVHRADRPAVAGLLRRRRAWRRLGLPLGDFDPGQPRLLHLVPVGQPAGRDLRRRDPGLSPERGDAGGDRHRLGLAHPVLHRLPDHPLHLRAAPDAGGDAGLSRHEEAPDAPPKCSHPRSRTGASSCSA